MIRLLGKLRAFVPLIYVLVLSAGFGSIGKYPCAGLVLITSAFFLAAFWIYIHRMVTPKEVKRLTVNDIHGPDSLEEYMAQRRKLEHED